MAQQVEVKVPDIGDFKEVEVIELLVKPGDAITKDQSLITVESDKASMEIPSSAAGIVKQLMVKLGDKVSKDSPLLVVDSDAQTAPAANTSPPAAEASRAAAVPPSRPRRHQPRQCRPPAPQPSQRLSKSPFPTSATSKKSKSSSCW